MPLADIDLRDRLEQRFGLPVALENDANGAAVAEHRLGAGRGSRHMVLLTLGTGIGGGLILNGELYRGAIGAAGELGHMTIKFDGPPLPGVLQRLRPPGDVHVGHAGAGARRATRGRTAGRGAGAGPGRGAGAQGDG